jgi:hypothetical protein
LFGDFEAAAGLEPVLDAAADTAVSGTSFCFLGPQPQVTPTTQEPYRYSHGPGHIPCHTSAPIAPVQSRPKSQESIFFQLPYERVLYHPRLLREHQAKDRRECIIYRFGIFLK